MILEAVDPGGVHVGVSRWKFLPTGRWGCLWSKEFTPEEYEDHLSKAMILGEIDVLVVEQWILFAGLAAEQTGSDMPTSQLIGVIKYIHRMTRAQWPGGECELVFQSVQVKVPTRSLLRARGVKSWAKQHKVTGDHVLDAELHAAHYIIHTLGQSVASVD